MALVHSVDLRTQPDGRVRALCVTADEEDRSDEALITHYTLIHASVAAALKQHGRSRISVSGIRVFVALDGQQLLPDVDRCLWCGGPAEADHRCPAAPVR